LVTINRFNLDQFRVEFRSTSTDSLHPTTKIDLRDLK
jgi:hypothetical protein